MRLAEYAYGILHDSAGVNFKHIITRLSLVGGLCPPDFLLVGATSWSRPGGRNQRYECHLGIPRLQNVRGTMNCATTNEFFLKWTVMGKRAKPNKFQKRRNKLRDYKRSTSQDAFTKRTYS